MNERKTYVILGLGRFGTTLAKELTDNNQDVIAIDKDLARVEHLSSTVANALCLDYTDIDALKAAGVCDADVGIVTTGTKLDQALLGVINLKDLGVPYVVAKAKDDKAKELMLKIGADTTVTPEKDMAKRVAKKLISNNILEIFDIDQDNSIFDMKIESSWVNKSLVDLDLRNKYALNVIGIRRDDKLTMNINPNEKLQENDELLIVGSNELFKNFNDINK